ncbi:alkaline phosphatase-like protein [Neurospora crassa]|uniref:GPI ethanolamine phosphate transferase 2 n=1 Tax=Neurospora crassa (strain ATCC 24698 / 74-OR23-1A / CBS 708.71 / DSM 1257 / FGSC 987) TaxID=367110 RepID=Q7SBA8_NEUCR|nr:transferase [Neurospora crassa OR74A]EAA33695.3 transferase [Neurospora crassa OR74A]KHE87047.1 alkaline phosphatase-like protein [Neurospora crassa]|eukprot:XP_962931.3 transferase [Neurospora crassa OR74A]
MSFRRNGNLSSTLLLIAANVLIPVAIVIFATGFFPYKPLLPGLAQYEPLDGYGEPPEAPFDKLVFMVVDALRSDFVYTTNSGFKFTQSLIRHGAAIPFTAHATSPTVTMPRLKAITTGSVPSFLDVVLNIDEGDESSSLASQDTWLAQMKAKDTGKLVMYGDDTWLKLFPGTFDRADGTTSFFVADFTEVDHNVTRNIPGELRNDDWNTMILHYLGLDHIGHKGGPRSPHMVPKQREMDGIVSQIYKAIETQDHLKSTLFVLCGDHGMNDAGNHGASSPGETSPALLFISPKLKGLQKNQDSPLPDAEDFQFYSTVEQSDLAPTLAALLGFPIPKNNLGVLIADFLSIWPKKADQAYLLHENARQIQTVISAASGTKTFDGALPAESCASPTSDYEQLACEWQGPSNNLMSARVGDDMDSQWALPVVTWLRKAQELMSGMASNYDMSRLILGQITALLAVIFSLSAAIKTVSPTRSLTPLLVISIAYSIMMFASSYVEEEQHFWYLATSTWFGYLTLRGFKRANTTFPAHLLLTAFPVLASLRLLRAWNQTGQKHAGTPDIVKLFIEPHPHFLWLLVGLTYFWTHRQLVYSFHGRIPVPINYPVMTGLVLAAFTFKAAFTLEDAPELVVEFVKSSLLDFTRGASLIARARAVFVGLGLVAMAAMGFILWEMRGAGGNRKRSRRKKGPAEAITTLQHLYTILALTQSRTANIPVFLIFNLLYWFLSSEIDAPDGTGLSTVELGISSLLLQYASFFAMGGSNAISSVDLSNAYNGVSNFNVVLVGILTYVGNWAGPVWWAFGTVVLLGEIWRRDQRQKRLGSGNNGKRGSDEKEEEAEAKQMLEGGQISPFKTYVAVTTLFTAFSVAAVMAACTILRTHLFVWTVFSPKYLYCVAWSLVQHLVINVGLSGLLFWLGSF